MTELKVFRPRLASDQVSSFDFNRASIALISDGKRNFVKRTVLASVPLSSEWHDPASLRVADWGAVKGADQADAGNTATLNTSIAA